MTTNIDALSMTRPGQDARDILFDHNRLNAWTEAARFAKRHGQGLLADPSHKPLGPGEILIRNETGSDRSMFEIVAFEEPVFTRAENASHFPVQTVMKGIEPDAIDHFAAWGVLLEPARTNHIARCLLSGVTVSLVNFANAAALAAHKYATALDATYANLESTFCGQARILWRESTAASGTLYWCKLLLGAPPVTELFGTLDEDLAQGSDAEMSVYVHNGSSWTDTTANVTVYDRLLKTGAADITSGKWVVARWYSGRWWVTSAECN